MAATATVIDPALRRLDVGDSRQPSNPRVSHQLTEAEKAQRKLNLAAAKIKSKALGEALDAFLVEQDVKLDKLAETHCVKRSYLDTQVNHRSNYTKSRAPSFANALVHYKAVQVNEGEYQPSKLLKNCIKDMLAEDEDLKPDNISEELHAEIMKNFIAYREGKKVGVRVSNKSAAQDARCTFENVNTELGNLTERVGTKSILFVTRSSISDSIAPGWFATSDSVDFLNDILGLDPWDVTRKFELWACSNAINTLPKVRAEITKMLLSGLRYITKRTKISMNFDNYETAIVLNMSVKLIGWTCGEIRSPSKIGSVCDLRDLRNALKTGMCRWVKLSKAQAKAHETALRTREAAGETVGKKRKSRSDKGKPRPHTRKRTAKQVNDSDEEAEDDEDEEDSEKGSDDEDLEDSEADAPPPPKKARKSVKVSSVKSTPGSASGKAAAAKRTAAVTPKRKTTSRRNAVPAASKHPKSASVVHSSDEDDLTTPPAGLALPGSLPTPVALNTAPAAITVPATPTIPLVPVIA
ncbi:hypothetical protein FA95DRAFT_1505777 [Auriscalpium vulgare]|uniref:Uncharacterized protein n=1 Tax=Auriscalpium vulgare TaxID=40419 RepID=A0ACB8R2Z1_9AGAM|nr:hypothetical protein FA95DRAFT_1505777 [Auriscalpium vulgare]